MTGVLRHRINADNHDLISDVIAATRTAVKKVRPLPRGDAARLCHAFLQGEINYIEEKGDQYTRMPWRTIADGRGDCKSFAVFVASLCAASGCRASLRFVKLPGDDHFGHVYAVIDGIAVDPCLEFGEECAYIASRTIRIT